MPFLYVLWLIFLSTDVKAWSIVQVCEWLEEISFGQYSDQFKAHEIRGQELVALQKSDLMVCIATLCIECCSSPAKGDGSRLLCTMQYCVCCTSQHCVLFQFNLGFFT